MKNSILLSLLVLFFTISIFSCNDDDDNVIQTTDINTPAELTRALNEIYNDSDVPGFAVSVVKNEEVIFQQSFGKSDLDAGKNYTNQTTQPIGSISKTFVAAAIVKAIEQGYFTLETDINEILPVEVKNPKHPDAVIEIKHLVTHTSGLVDNYDAYLQAYHILPGEDLSTDGSQLMLNAFDLKQRESLPLEEFLAEYYLEDGELYSMENFASTAPGKTWNYSNIATSLAAYLVEAATEIPFKEYVITNILQPLEMNNTAYDVAELNAANYAKLYWDENTPLPLYGNDSYPDGGIHTNNEDLAKYLIDMMKGAKGQSTTLFSKESYDLLFSSLLPQGVIHPAVGDFQSVFWTVDNGEIQHDGSDPGTTCNLQFDKNGNSGYFVLTNMDASVYEKELAYLEFADKVNSSISKFINNN